MEIDTLQIGSISKDSSTTDIHPDTFVSKDASSTISTFDTLSSKDLNQLIAIIETEHAINNKLTSTVSVLSVVMAISIIFNIILLIILKKNKNKSNNKMEQQEENKTQVHKVDTFKNEHSKKDSEEATPSIQVTGATPNVTQNEEKKSNNRIRLYTETKTNRMSIYGMSIQGKGHISDNTPCQDCHQVEILDAEKNTGIAVVSDGAGSAKNSAEGSKIVCESSIKYMKMAIEKLQWNDSKKLPNEALWNKVIREVVRLVQIDLNEKAKSMGCELRSLAATFIILYFTPEKSYFAHVGDGRAGVKTDEGWKAILTPHKGEETNQTVFVSNEILNPTDLKISGVSVPETLVIDKPIFAFILMSDGCEDGLWIKNKKEDLPNGDFRYVTLNQPFAPAIEKLIQVIQDKRFENQEKEVLFQFMDRYNDNLKSEIDDKTLCFGTLSI